MNWVIPKSVIDFRRVEHADGTEQIVVVLEARVDALEQEVARMEVEGRDRHQAQIRVLNSLRVTQVEHGETLKEHGRALGEIQGTLKEHGTAIGEIQGTLKEHSTAIGEIQGTLKEHSTAIADLRETQLEHGTAIASLRETQLEHGTAIAGLRETQLEHGRLLREVGLGMAGITRSLDYLISQQGQSQS
jgi:chromosome segregation ATPase